MKISCVYLPTAIFFSTPFSGFHFNGFVNANLYRTFIFSFLLFIVEPGFSQETLMGLTSNGGPGGKGTAFTIQTNGNAFTIVNAFNDWGKNPSGSLTKGNDGNYYGMTPDGGTYNAGTIFRVTPEGVLTVIHHFNFTTEGSLATGNLVLGADGNFYGMTRNGGPSLYGTIFKISPNGVFTVIRSFAYATDGGNPYGQVVIGKDGNFYGITSRGGTSGNGTIFKLTPAGQFSVIKTLNANAKLEGNYCYGGLTVGSDGNLYGITNLGGTYAYGTIFKCTTSGSFTVLRHLSQATDGYFYRNDLIQGTDGYLYGMAYQGGANGQGTIFKISTTGDFKVLRNLNYSNDGGSAGVSLIEGTDGVFYGLTQRGGAYSNGTIFKITAAGVYTVLRSLKTTTDGGVPKGSLIKGFDGNFYGMNSEGGAGSLGTIFKITPAGVYTVLTNLNGAQFGNEPLESLAQGVDYGFFGTTAGGGTNNNGSIFKICGSTYKVLRSLSKYIDGGRPKGSLLLAKDGNFYGTASEGGTSNAGTVFKITPAGVFSVIHTMVGAKDGSFPQGTLVQGTDGNLYGTTLQGGTNGIGTIFKMTTTGVISVLRNLVSATDGAHPEGGLVQGTGDAYFGMTSNNTTIFKVTSAGAFTVIKKLNATTDGGAATGNLVKATDGNFYGLASTGGTYNVGTIFRISEAGVFKVLKHFKAETDGSLPKGSLVQAADGNLYGMTSAGGSYKSGTIFKITTAGVFTVLRHLNIETDGANPNGGLIIQKKNPLIANPQSVTATEDVGKQVILSGSGATPLTYTIVTPPKKGSVTGGSTATRTYLGSANYAGKDSFYFVANFGCISSLPAKVLINVTPVNNDAPVLDSIRNRQVKVSSLLTFTVNATEYDAGQTKTFSLVSPPAGATIDARTGVFRWTPATTGIVKIKFRVTDNGVPSLFDEELVTITVATNFAPVLKPIGNAVVQAGVPMTFTATATDVDAGQTKTFSLITPPKGATIDAKSGVFKWTPGATGIVKFKVRVTDNGVPVLYDEEEITITVKNTLRSDPDISSFAENDGTITPLLYPNPVNSRTIIKLPHTGSGYTMILTDLGGRIVDDWNMSKFGGGNVELDLTRVRSGQYILVVRNKEKSWNIKVVKL